MNEIIFESDRHFVLYGIMVSHGQLLIRSQKSNKEPYNIDIIFFNTGYMQLPAWFYGMRISLNTNNTIPYQFVEKYLKYKSNYLFELKSSGEKFYVGASYCKVFENELDFNDSSLGFDEIKKGKMLITALS